MTLGCLEYNDIEFIPRGAWNTMTLYLVIRNRSPWLYKKTLPDEFRQGVIFHFSAIFSKI